VFLFLGAFKPPSENMIPDASTGREEKGNQQSK
jgi:hypothetical protein